MSCVLLLLLSVLGIVPDEHKFDWQWMIVRQHWQGQFHKDIYLKEAVDVNELSREMLMPEYIDANDVVTLVVLPRLHPPDPNLPTWSLPMRYFKVQLPPEPDLVMRYWVDGTMYHFFSYCIYNNKDSVITSTIPARTRPCRNCYRILKRYEEAAQPQKGDSDE